MLLAAPGIDDKGGWSALPKASLLARVAPDLLDNAVPPAANAGTTEPTAVALTAGTAARRLDRAGPAASAVGDAHAARDRTRGPV